MLIPRRRFIRTVLLAGGAVFTSWNDVRAAAGTSASVRTRSLRFPRAHELLRDGHAMPAFPAPSRSIDVVVIGGGAAGLAAAWRLRKEGREVLVLENEPAAGGVMLNPAPAWHGIDYPLGSTYFYRYSGTHRAFLDDIAARPIETGEDALVLPGHEPVVDWWNTRNLSQLPLPETEKDAFRKFRAVLLSTPVPPYPLATAPREMIERFGSLSAADYVRNFQSTALGDLMDLYCRSVFGAPAGEVSAYALINFYALEFGDSFQIPCYTFPGGLGAIARKAQAWLGDALVNDALVVSVEEVGHVGRVGHVGHVRQTGRADGSIIVHYLHGETGEPQTLAAHAAIVAVPKPVARHIVRGLPREQFEAMGRVRYAPYVTVGAMCNAPLFEERAFDFWISDRERRFTDVIDATSSQDAAEGRAERRSGEFIYMISSPRPVADRKKMEDASWLAAFAQEAARALAEHVPGAEEKIEELHVFGWGHSMVVPQAGTIGTLDAAIGRPLGRISFAHSDNDLAPAIENAMDAGFTAAERAAR